MTETPDPVLPTPAAGGVAPGRLSGWVVGQLEPGEQFVLWALRQRLRDAGEPRPALVHGFRLAFGLARLEPALAALEALFGPLAGAGLFPLRCACVSAGERRAIGLVAAAQAGDGPWLAALAERLAPADAAALRRGAVAFAAELRRADLSLPPLATRAAPPVAPAAASATLH